MPGLALYAAGRALGITVQVQASPLGAAWWTVPLLLLAALRAGLTEEVIFIGYLFDRLRRLGWGWWSIILTTAALRGAYHAYQGIGPIVGNFAMGVVFGWCYRRWGRVMPLVIAHTVIDIVAFVGYPARRGAVARPVRPGALAEPVPDADAQPDARRLSAPARLGGSECPRPASARRDCKYARCSLGARLESRGSGSSSRCTRAGRSPPAQVQRGTDSSTSCERWRRRSAHSKPGMT